MKRDIELVRKILLRVEEKFEPGTGWINNLKIDHYEMETVAEHCDLLYQNKLIREYKPFYADDQIYSFGVGPLTQEGYHFLDQIRDETTWKKTVKEINEKNLPGTIETYGCVAASIAGAFLREYNR
ncbi:DUF2513 domain-containing protein [Anoxynatronum sibiricum]|uniref:DUF2513 domain-containing protein n=1 Tax=Anoxynatronum sibiricum TaxID=210623 RepID=A0ABU9VX52_9CLOT